MITASSHPRDFVTSLLANVGITSGSHQCFFKAKKDMKMKMKIFIKNLPNQAYFQAPPFATKAFNATEPCLAGDRR